MAFDGTVLPYEFHVEAKPFNRGRCVCVIVAHMPSGAMAWSNMWAYEDKAPCLPWLMAKAKKIADVHFLQSVTGEFFPLPDHLDWYQDTTIKA